MIGIDEIIMEDFDEMTGELAALADELDVAGDSSREE